MSQKVSDPKKFLADYIGSLPRRGPLQFDSMLAWVGLLSVQEDWQLKGDLLEIGVEFGTSALLMLKFRRPKEHATLIDLKMTAEVRQGLSNYGLSDSPLVNFVEGSSMQMQTSDLKGKFRWAHIDGGHEYKHVRNDAALVAPAVLDDGVLIFDDFFEIRWPDVTRAAMEFLAGQDRMVPFLLVGRKLYCCSRGAAERYRKDFQAKLTAFRLESSVKFWTVAFGAHETLVMKTDFRV